MRFEKFGFGVVGLVGFAETPSQPVFKNSLFGCSGSGSAVLAIGSGSGFRVYPILDPSPTPKNPNPEIYPDEIFFKDFSVFRGGIA